MRALPLLMAVSLVACKGDSGFVTLDAEPSVSITDPNDGESFDQGTLVEFGAVVSDDQPGLDLTWSSDLDGTLAEENTESREVLFSIASLSVGVHTITLTAVDSGAQSSEDSISIEILEVAEEPIIVVIHPASGETGSEGIPFALQAQVDDQQDDKIEMRVDFVSDADGTLCSDVTPDLAGIATCSATPSAGQHVLTFTVTDTDGLMAQATAIFSVTSSLDVDNDGDGFTENQGDCNDNNPAVNPNAPEFYNGVDDDCDGLIDNNTDGYDDDGDGFTELNGDCDDDDPLINPNATEYADGVDNDCDGLIDNNTDSFDDDGDGFSEATGDCNDNNINISPNASDIPYNGVDEDCDGTDLNDVDGDGHIADFVLGGDDCDDNDPGISPSEDDIPYNGDDEDCDGDDLTDVDGDGFDSDVVFNGTDCDDTDPHINPGATDIPYDGVDQDCIGGDLLDGDGDGQNAVSVGGTDCNDTDATIYNGAPEVPYDGIDQSCSGHDLTDVDGDGFEGVHAGGNDCDDEEPDINPGEAEIPYNGIDDNCSGADLTDVDGDGFDGPSSTGEDCNDNNASINPHAAEVPYNGTDEDCSGADLLDVDGDGFNSTTVGGQDCDDGNASIRPNATEQCDGVDNNCNSQTDEPGASGCTSYLFDGDGDGYGVNSPAAQCLCDASAPYTATQGGDCFDGNDQAYSGQTSYFSTHRGDGSFDYNCAAGEELLYTETAQEQCHYDTSGWPWEWGCEGNPGWEGSRPSCGETEVYQSGCEFVVALDGCQNTTVVSRVQSCR